jgi:DivIVA domain-containing protein
MDVVLVVAAIGLIGLVAAVAFGRVRGGLDDPPVARPDIELPPGRLGAADLAGLRFSVALRGYRMDEVDSVLDRLRSELRTRDAELAELQHTGDLWGAHQVPDAHLSDDRLPDPAEP